MPRAGTIESMTTVTKLTAEEFLAMDDPRRGLQLIDGEVVVNQPGWIHQQAGTRLLTALDRWIVDGGGNGVAIMPLDVRLADDQVYAPDVLWYASGREIPERAPYPLPDLAVEVRSPSTWRYDVGVKQRVYEARGLPELWLVDTESRSVLVYRRSAPQTPEFDVALEETDTLASPLLPGFELPVSRLFAR